MRLVLRLGIFRRLLVAFALNALALQLAAVALTVAVYRHTHSAAGAAALFLCAQVIPGVIAPPIVARVARLPTRGVLPALYALEAVVSLALAWSVTHLAVGPILVLTLIDGAAAVTVSAIVFASSARATAPAGFLREANALLNTAFMVCLMVGPGIGGAIVAANGASTVLLLNAGLFALMALTLAGVKPRTEPGGGQVAGAGLRTALRYAARTPTLRRLLVLEAIALVFFTISLPVEIVFTSRSLHTGASGYGSLLAAWGAGALVGSALYARFRGMSTRALLSLSGSALGLGFALMATAPTIAVAVVASAVAGTGNGVNVVAARTAIQELVSDELMTLMMSFVESTGRIVPGIGIVLGGASTLLFGPRPALGLAAGGSLLVSIAAWFLLATPESAKPRSDAQQTAVAVPRVSPQPATQRPNSE
ncbi:MAG: hypothetical protein JWP44_5169 [Mucilaginibacter sp.]|nr:hypothetical protein [Mucilaginibacter sp.]